MEVSVWRQLKTRRGFCQLDKTLWRILTDEVIGSHVVRKGGAGHDAYGIIGDVRLAVTDLKPGDAEKCEE